MYLGPSIDDPEILSLLPADIGDYLLSTNGYVAYHGGFHLRGACKAPLWHSLREVWLGDHALSRLFPTVRPEDVPFGQDALGNQFLLRDGLVHCLLAETGDLECLSVDFEAFDLEVRSDPVAYLDLGTLNEFRSAGNELEPGYLLHVYPPFYTAESQNGVSIRPIPALELIGSLASIADQLRDVPDGSRIQFVIARPPSN